MIEKAIYVRLSEKSSDEELIKMVSLLVAELEERGWLWSRLARELPARVRAHTYDY